MEDEIEQVYSAEDIQKILKIGKNKLYNCLLYTSDAADE